MAAEPNDLCSSTDPEVKPHSFHSNTQQSLKSQSSVSSVTETLIGMYAYVQSTVLYCNRLVASLCCWRTTTWSHPQPGGLQEGNRIKKKKRKPSASLVTSDPLVFSLHRVCRHKCFNFLCSRPRHLHLRVVKFELPSCPLGSSVSRVSFHGQEQLESSYRATVMSQLELFRSVRI